MLLFSEYYLLFLFSAIWLSLHLNHTKKKQKREKKNRDSFFAQKKNQISSIPKSFRQCLLAGEFFWRLSFLVIAGKFSHFFDFYGMFVLDLSFVHWLRFLFYFCFPGLGRLRWWISMFSKSRSINVDQSLWNLFLNPCLGLWIVSLVTSIKQRLEQIFWLKRFKLMIESSLYR